MQVNLKESEIARGVELYLNSRGVITAGMDVTIQFSMGKGANGLKVQIDIEPKEGEDDNSTTLLATVQDEPEVSPTSIAGKIKSHTAEVQAAKEEEAKASPVLTKRQVAAVVAAEGKAAVAAAAELPVETPPPAPEPEMETLATVTVTDAEKAEAQAAIAAEDQPDAGQPEPAKPAGRKPIFGKKVAAPAPVIEPDPEPEVAAKAVQDAEEVDPPFLVDDAQPSDEEVAAQLAQPAPAARRPVASLFAKKA